MANRKATMADLKSVMRALSKGTPIREIERQLGLSRRSIAVYRDRAEASGRVIGKILCSENGKDGCSKNGNKNTVKSETMVQ